MENRKILVVDDDARLRELLQRYLTQQGYTVESLPDARDLDRKLARNRPDLLVLDVMMPGEDGLAVVRRLRAQGEPIPVVMLTARGEDIDRILGLEMGADDYLAKPFNPRELLARINAVLRRYEQTPAVTASHQEAEALHFGACTLNPSRRELLRDGQPVDADHGRIRRTAGAGDPPAPPADPRAADDAGHGQGRWRVAGSQH